MTERGWKDRAPGESWKTGSAATDERRERYLEWLLTPESHRKPRLKKDLAEEMGITYQALSYYAKDPVFQKELRRRQNELGRVEKAPAVMQALYEQAIDPLNSRSVQAAKVWLDHTYKSLDAAVDALDMEGMTDEELGKMAWEILSRVSTHQGAEPRTHEQA